MQIMGTKGGLFVATYYNTYLHYPMRPEERGVIVTSPRK